MKLKNFTEEEIETMSFDDIAYAILKEKGKKMKIADIFKTVCSLLHMSDAEYEARIGDFFALLTTEKRFIQLEKGYWDLRENHSQKIDLDEVDDEEEITEDDDTIVEEDDEMYIDETKEPDDDETDDDLKDLVVMDEEQEDLEI